MTVSFSSLAIQSIILLLPHFFLSSCNCETVSVSSDDNIDNMIWSSLNPHFSSHVGTIAFFCIDCQSLNPETVSFWKFLTPFLIVGVPLVLILKEPDLGTGLLLVPILFSMLYLWGVKKRYLFLMVLAAVLASPVLFSCLKEYQKTRLMVFINPNVDPLGAGYTIIQSKIAIGSGGFLGKGFMGGTQNQLNFVPERHTDFIFPVIAEEGGLLASLAVILLFGWIAKKGFEIASQTPDRFGSELACGITVFLACQVIMNLGMTMGLLPVVGVPLPLVSYGGSSVVITMLSIGLLLNIKMHRPLF